MGHAQRTTQKSVPVDNGRTKPTKLHRRFAYFICRKIGTTGIPTGILTEEDTPQPALHPFLKKIERTKPQI